MNYKYKTYEWNEVWVSWGNWGSKMLAHFDVLSWCSSAAWEETQWEDQLNPFSGVVIG